ncbi:MAG: excinuclease ABC subunit UvrA [Clostridia bacterium]|nr:excinuclease ABC subunit UvrA [Clostridia bacterium]
MENNVDYKIMIRGLEENNLKRISLDIPKGKIVVFTGVSGSGKSSIVFDTIAAESQRQLNETYTAFIRGRLPKYEKPKAESIQNLTPSVVVDQSPFGGNARSTVGTMTDLYSELRLLFSRLGEPCAGSSSAYSFNEPDGMCKRCSGLGRITSIDLNLIIDWSKSLNQGAILESTFTVNKWLWLQYANSGLFNMDKPIKEYNECELNLLLYGSPDGVSEPVDPKIEGVASRLTRLYLKRDLSGMSQHSKDKMASLLTEVKCPDCHGMRLNEKALNSKINGKNIVELSNMELNDLVEELKKITAPHVQTIIDSLVNGLNRIINIGLPYLHLNREASTLSGGEAQRLKMVRFMGSSLTGMTYIFDEPSTGLHPRDVNRLNQLLLSLREKGNTVMIVEHDKDVIRIGDEIIDIGPQAGSKGGRVCFQGSYGDMLKSDTLTGRYLKHHFPVNGSPRKAKSYYPIRNANLHNLKNINVDIPLGIFTVITGVAGSGKSTLISRVFSNHCPDVVRVDQGAITANNRSTPASYLGFMDDIRNLFARENGVDIGYFSFNSKGACPMCSGKGVIVTEMAFMDPVTTVCEMCEGKRFSDESLSHRYKGKNIQEVLEMNVTDAMEFFEETKIIYELEALQKVGIGYMTLGQPLSTLSGGERQRIKLAKHLNNKGSIFVLDEPTTGLHLSDIEKLVKLFHSMVDSGNTILVIEHNLDVVKQADWIIDIGPDGGKNGGQIIFEGTPLEMVQKGTGITAEYLRKDLDASACLC